MSSCHCGQHAYTAEFVGGPLDGRRCGVDELSETLCAITTNGTQLLALADGPVLVVTPVPLDELAPGSVDIHGYWLEAHTAMDEGVYYWDPNLVYRS